MDAKIYPNEMIVSVFTIILLWENENSREISAGIKIAIKR